MKLNRYILGLAAAAVVCSFAACKKSYLDRMPSDEAPLEDVFKTTDAAEAALQGLHSLMYEARDEEQFGLACMNLVNDMMGEDMVLSDYGAGWFIATYQYQDSRSGGGTAAYAWNFYYRVIANANQITSHIDAAEGPDIEKAYIKGQALAYRAFAYFQLIKLYQHTFMAVVPSAPGLPIYTEPTQEGAPRASIKAVYDRINADLSEADALLEQFGSTRVDKSDINIEVVRGLRARVALVQGNWSDAAQYAAFARQNYPIMDASVVTNGFNDWGNSEWIWASRLVEEQTNNTHSFIGQMDVDAGVYAALGQQKLINSKLWVQMSDADVRRGWWYASAEGSYDKYNQKKFRVRVPGTFANDIVNMRAAEMVLIEAEAKAKMNDLAGAAAALEELMAQRDETFVAPTSKEDLLREIWLQRRIELWGEGFRFTDIKRSATFDYLTPNEKGLHREGTGAQDAIVGATKTITDPLDPKFLYRIPGAEMSNNSNMGPGDQNP